MAKTKKTTKKVVIKSDWKQTVLRLPYDLDEWVQDKANEMVISKNTFMVMCIQTVKAMEVMNTTCDFGSLLLAKNVNNEVLAAVENAADKVFNTLKDSMSGKTSEKDSRKK